MRFANESTREAKKSPPTVQEGRDRGVKRIKGRGVPIADYARSALAKVPCFLLAGLLEYRRSGCPAPAVQEFPFR